MAARAKKKASEAVPVVEVFVPPVLPEGVIPPGYDIDADDVASFVCPVCHEKGEPDTYAEHAATHEGLLTACVEAVSTVSEQAGALGATEPDVQRALALVSEPSIAEMLAEAPVEG
jgi:hypothetical protein